MPSALRTPASPIADPSRTGAPPRRPLVLRLLDWLAAADRRHRERRRLERLDDDCLHDVGVSRDALDAMLLERYGRVPGDRDAPGITLHLPL